MKTCKKSGLFRKGYPSQKMLSFVLSAVTELTVGTVKYAYSWGRYFVYGHEETTDEKLDKVTKECREIKEDYKQLLHTLEEIKEQIAHPHDQPKSVEPSPSEKETLAPTQAPEATDKVESSSSQLMTAN